MVRQTASYLRARLLIGRGRFGDASGGVYERRCGSTGCGARSDQVADAYRWMVAAHRGLRRRRPGGAARGRGAPCTQRLGLTAMPRLST